MNPIKWPVAGLVGFGLVMDVGYVVDGEKAPDHKKHAIPSAAIGVAMATTSSASAGAHFTMLDATLGREISAPSTPMLQQFTFYRS